MKSRVLSATIVVALVTTVGVAAARTATTMNPANDDALNLTSSQRRDIYRDVGELKPNSAAPAGFTAKVGEAVPSSMTINPLPASVTKRVPAVKSDDFAMAGKDLLIVSPGSKKIADIITR